MSGDFFMVFFYSSAVWVRTCMGAWWGGGILYRAGCDGFGHVVLEKRKLKAREHGDEQVKGRRGHGDRKRLEIV